MKLTQGVLKYCNLYGMTFDNKYSDSKTIVTTNNYNSVNNNSTVTSQTSTVLSNNNSYYNRIEKCELFDCNVINGTFTDCDFIGITTGITNYITDGVFSGCTFTGYVINGGKFYNCKVSPNNLWENGFWDNTNGTDDFLAAWHDGVWNNGHFASSFGWTGGTFNKGIFEYPAIWYNGIANGGTFRTTWYHGLVRNGNFVDCVFENGVFNKGNFSGGYWNGGVFNNGLMSGTIISGGTFNNGTIYRGLILDCDVKGGTFNRVNISGGTFNMTMGSELIVKGGDFYGGTYNGGTYKDCAIYGGQFDNIVTIKGLQVHNGAFVNSNFKGSYIHNGNFKGCYVSGATWEYGVFTEGNMISSKWYDGYWNDSNFASATNDNLTLIKNGGGLGQTDWVGGIPSGLATYWTLSAVTGSIISKAIVTGNGFLGSAQRISTGISGKYYGVYNNDYTLKSGVTYKLTFKYRCGLTTGLPPITPMAPIPMIPTPPIPIVSRKIPLIVCDTKSNLNTLSEQSIFTENTGSAKEVTLYLTFNNNSRLCFCGTGNVGAWFEIDGIELVDTSNYSAVWYDGHFYGGVFQGIWYGGTFHYGTRDNITYTPPPKYKWSITNIQTSKNSPPPAF